MSSYLLQRMEQGIYLSNSRWFYAKDHVVVVVVAFPLVWEEFSEAMRQYGMADVVRGVSAHHTAVILRVQLGRIARNASYGIGDSVSLHFGSKLRRTENGSSLTIATIHQNRSSALPIPLFTYHISFFLLQRHSNWLSGDTSLHRTSKPYRAGNLRRLGSFVWNSLPASVPRFDSNERTKNAFRSCRPLEFAHCDTTIGYSMSTNRGNGETTRWWPVTQSNGVKGSFVELQYFE